MGEGRERGGGAVWRRGKGGVLGLGPLRLREAYLSILSISYLTLRCFGAAASTLALQLASSRPSSALADSDCCAPLPPRPVLGGGGTQSVVYALCIGLAGGLPRLLKWSLRCIWGLSLAPMGTSQPWTAMPRANPCMSSVPSYAARTGAPRSLQSPALPPC